MRLFHIVGLTAQYYRLSIPILVLCKLGSLGMMLQCDLKVVIAVVLHL